MLCRAHADAGGKLPGDKLRLRLLICVLPRTITDAILYAITDAVLYAETRTGQRVNWCKITQMATKTILITGGSGYLGSHLIAHLQAEGGWRVGYTFQSNAVPDGTFGAAQGFRVDLATGDGLDAVFQVRSNRVCAAIRYHRRFSATPRTIRGCRRLASAPGKRGAGRRRPARNRGSQYPQALGQVDVVVNTAAISQPAVRAARPGAASPRRGNPLAVSRHAQRGGGVSCAAAARAPPQANGAVRRPLRPCALATLQCCRASRPGAINQSATRVSHAQLCERDYARARAINVPDALVAALERQKSGSGGEALLIHLSTDQVCVCARVC